MSAVRVCHEVELAMAMLSVTETGIFGYVLMGSVLLLDSRGFCS
jgi:hypothetical protein